MKYRKGISWLAFILSLTSLAVALTALRSSRIARDLALTGIEVQERNNLLTPVFDQETERWLFLAVYEVSITHVGGPAVTLRRLCRETSGSGFLVLLAGEEVVNLDMPVSTFWVEPSLAEIQADPRLLKGVMANEMDGCHELDLRLGSGEARTVRFGLALSPYESGPEPGARMALVSYRFCFDHERTLFFRRGFAIPALPGE